MKLDISLPLQTKMKEYALAIAGHRAVQDWHDFKRLLTSRPASRNGSQPLQQLQALPPEFARFYHAYDQVETADTAENFKAITYRYQMVKHFQLYHAAESVPLGDEPVYHVGQTRLAQRKRFLFHLLYRGYDGVRDIMANEASKRDWSDFTRRLSAAKRWQGISEALGYGVLALIPESVVPNHWVQRGTTDPQFAVWVRAISHFNPKGHMACLSWGKELDRVLSGRLP
jgi:hypothetical protein